MKKEQLFHTTSLKEGQIIYGYARLISRDGGRSGNYHFGYAKDIIRPYRVYTGTLDAPEFYKPTYPQIFLNLQDASPNRNKYDPDNVHIHLFHARGSVIKVHTTAKESWYGNLVDVDNFMITEEERYYHNSRASLRCDRCGSGMELRDTKNYYHWVCGNSECEDYEE